MVLRALRLPRACDGFRKGPRASVFSGGTSATLPGKEVLSGVGLGCASFLIHMRVLFGKSQCLAEGPGLWRGQDWFKDLEGIPQGTVPIAVVMCLSPCPLQLPSVLMPGTHSSPLPAPHLFPFLPPFLPPTCPLPAPHLSPFLPPT